MIRQVTYECRDIGYGVESGFEIGIWGERDWTGKRVFQPLNSPRIYLFDDEIVNDDEADCGYILEVLDRMNPGKD